MTNSPVLIEEVKDHIGRLTINRPEKRNALSPELLANLHMTLSRWAQTDDIRAVVISGGSDKAFSSGYDVSAIPTNVPPEMAELLKTQNPLTLALDSVRNYPYPVIAMMNGYAFGAGLNLAICCDIRIAVDTIKVGMPPARLGLVYHPEGLKQFADVLGPAVTREVFFTARTYEGAEVLAAGFVHRLEPAADLKTITFDVARQIAGNAPLSLKGMKEIMNMLARAAEFKSQDLSRAEIIIKESFASRDLAEGQTAFLEKRPPVFTGR
jgi:enoyl-CoA hydratase/carnithine racemase